MIIKNVFHTCILWVIIIVYDIITDLMQSTVGIWKQILTRDKLAGRSQRNCALHAAVIARFWLCYAMPRQTLWAHK